MRCVWTPWPRFCSGEAGVAVCPLLQRETAGLPLAACATASMSVRVVVQHMVCRVCQYAAQHMPRLLTPLLLHPVLSPAQGFRPPPPRSPLRTLHHWVVPFLVGSGCTALGFAAYGCVRERHITAGTAGHAQQRHRLLAAGRRDCRTGRTGLRSGSPYLAMQACAAGVQPFQAAYMHAPQSLLLGCVLPAAAARMPTCTVIAPMQRTPHAPVPCPPPQCATGHTMHRPAAAAA